jgi:hypothetical protein
MADKDDGGPAFPTQQERGTQGDILEYSQSGMTLRDYFAVHASEADLQAVAYAVGDVPEVRSSGGWKEVVKTKPADWRQRARYLHADRMLAARGAGQ